MSKRFCSYCNSLKDEETFVKLKTGKGGRIIKYKCGDCHAAGKLPQAKRDEAGKRLTERNRASDRERRAWKPISEMNN